MTATAAQPQVQPLTYAEAQERMGKATRTIRNLERAYSRAQSDYAAAESNYRQQLGEAYRRHRNAGLAQTEADVAAKAEVANLSFARDERKGEIAALAEKLEDRRGERNSLHRLVDWSMGVDLAARKVA